MGQIDWYGVQFRMVCMWTLCTAIYMMMVFKLNDSA